jgi:hypothetical protein
VFKGMADMETMCCPPEVQPPNQTTQNMKIQMQFLMVLHLIFGIIKLFLISTTFADFFCAIILCCCWRSLDFCQTAIYTIFVLFEAMVLIFELGDSIQSQFDYTNSTVLITSIVVALNIVFYIVAIFLTFRAYKEFKALTIEGVIPGRQMLQWHRVLGAGSRNGRLPNEGYQNIDFGIF